MTIKIDPEIKSFVDNIEKSLTERFESINEVAEYNFNRVLNAMQEVHLSESHFLPSSGYGYDDLGREALEMIYAKIFRTESALVRPHITSGTHAIACALYGNLRPEDELLAITGSPYDTVRSFIASESLTGNGTLEELGIKYKQVDLKDNKIDIDRVLDEINDKTKIVYLQRSSGYSGRPAITLEEIGESIEYLKAKKPDLIIFLDNCYGEFLEKEEPADYGVDLIAGSLIKNPGGGLAPTGGYVAGRSDLVERAAARLSAPGIGAEVGATMGWTKTVLQGLFFAPTVTADAIKSAVLISKLYEKLGFTAIPRAEDKRSDIIQIIELGSPEAVEAFCCAIQQAAPVNSFVTPIADEMPGYEDPVIMAAGSFIQGSSIELSADAPMREPYRVYFQGGLNFYHGKLAALYTLQQLSEKGIINVRKRKD